LVEGVRKGASDIHFVPKPGNKTEILIRIDGNLQPWHVQDGTLPEAVVAVVKDRSKGMDRFEREMAQDGFIQREIDDQVIRFRVSVLPTVGTELKNKFESVVIRILDDRKVIKDLDKLGLAGYAKAFQKAIKQPQGMVILTGPTGSGKSTTLVAALHQVIDPTVNVLTVEDPVEYVIQGARQLKIGYKMNFEQAIRSILRHDPDIVLVGEMRDKETAEVAIKLANTGHLTFSTLHTNDAPSAVSRLYKMGIEPFLIAYAINIIVAQRLIRRLCDNCKKKISKIDDAYVEHLNLNFEDWKKSFCL
jgi:type IV pilus assembly protein PilB